ncbi:alpha/beta hydrolase [Nocardia terpenica]|uniref:alpha/beta fold hydrolase n=1 Tax=Nocardia terpenica TaxID=455432 RepID=UPI001894E284|nr:alpha/beta hydrolase [Nocardia terpenica]MBF6062126.1 alpha/beta hydrolase [Nocardia terpenica]MBF6104214.1 alpha/beta hydrolase [Nocardia terpenica]MBF6109930.1 alpha/beta hydrolase [Nocardia terpenica]MBF6120236.1 alpha/beta hydrolase [Nocardia terpenica]MBF6152647.1 alpha/beta hydrolase [Nocardia terpenica]
MSTIIARGQRFRIADSGGRGSAIVFLHGNLMDSTMWDPVIGSLGDYRCLRFDFRLHGATDDDGLPFTYWDAARDALGILDALGVPAAHFVGHSQGGFTALRAALLAPQRITSMTLIDSAADAFPGPALEQMARIRDGFAADAVAATGSAVLDLLLGTDDEAAAHWLARMQRQPADRLSRAVGVLMGTDSITDRLAEISTPTLVVHGSADVPIPPEAGTALATALPAAEPFELLDGAAHTPPVTHPAEVSALLHPFLEKNIFGSREQEGHPGRSATI